VKGGVTRPAQAARAAKHALARLARPPGAFDASRYFRGAAGLGFYNIGADRVRAMARQIVRDHPVWTVDDACAFASALITDRHLEVKGIGIEVLGRYRREFTPALLPTWKRWLANGHSANWATTDAICGLLVGPLLAAHPRLAGQVAGWAGHSSMWVRRASIVGLIPIARRGVALDTLYRTARKLHRDDEDLIQKAVGWALREAGKTDMDRLEHYLLGNGPAIPRTSVRYAIERFPPRKRRQLLVTTRIGKATHREQRTQRRRGRVAAGGMEPKTIPVNLLLPR
jgi:3-methyladenine DNA glycosylase AlkD